MKRIFLGIKVHPTPAFIEQYVYINQKLKYERIKWVEKDNLHLTLHFFGDTPEDLIGDIIRITNKIVAGQENFELIFRTLGVFRSIQHPRVIWIGCDDCSKLAGMKQQLDMAYKTLGLQVEDRDFQPHLTIGRVKELRMHNPLTELITKFRDTVFLRQQTDSIILFESKLRTSGPVYIPIREFRLTSG